MSSARISADAAAAILSKMSRAEPHDELAELPVAHLVHFCFMQPFLVRKAHAHGPAPAAKCASNASMTPLGSLVLVSMTVSVPGLKENSLSSKRSFLTPPPPPPPPAPLLPP